ncbi:Similar to Cdt1: DNA replication factor Cdt1 (Mus musculus) [Cotesia congregata]|uniref:Similar to Cdt1: DNA replication factor Cdt1 (Mus musculus) n=1 Tax=Cotesia congregata TaxID=51543 RepID=A0A8J2MGQ6_COTCN|nr:Similar to Cdt1: DNA replication factor Cdt1 (Mus musculus) [Cotesia congregata]
MSQTSVTAYFNSRKRQATDELKNKTKVLILERDKMQITRATDKINEDIELDNESVKIIKKNDATEKINVVKRIIQFDGAKITTPRTPRVTRSRIKSKKNTVLEGQTDIMKSFLKINNEKQNVVFEKKGLLSPRKNLTSKGVIEEQSGGSIIPKTIPLMERLAQQDLSLEEIKNRINKSSRLAELKKRIDIINECKKKLDSLQNSDEPLPKIKKFDKIQLEVPVSPQKSLKSPLKTPVKKIDLSSNASPQRRLLFSPKESTPSPVKCSPTKTPAYQRYQSISQSETPALSLPFSYRFLAEVFRCIDTVAAMLFNRKETITFRKLKPAVQELLRHNFTLEHLAQIKSIYPDAYNFSQEKMRNFGSTSKLEKYELVLKPFVENTTKKRSDRDNLDDNNIYNTTSDTTMGPNVLLQRRRKLYHALLERTKMHHEIFLKSLESPLVIPKEKITRWHPEFDVDNCPTIEVAELPQPPTTEKALSAKDVLVIISSTMMKYSVCHENNNYLIRAKQAAKALEAMTRTPNEEKEATIYARLPELAKILRNIFVAEKKCVLLLEFVIDKLDNSYRTKLTSKELEEHIKLMCKLLPTWATIHHIRKQDYLKISKDVDIAKVVKKYELQANDKLKV